MQELDTSKKIHKWYYFTENNFLPAENLNQINSTASKPWTEAVRICSAAKNYALVNHLGIIEFTPNQIKLYQDRNIFNSSSVGSLVFSKQTPVFYCYKNSFFNTNSQTATSGLRSFLVEFSPQSKLFFPLVSYQNLGLNDEEITGFFWDGKTWTCSAKKSKTAEVAFRYFIWEPPVDLVDINAAINTEAFFHIKECSEADYRKVNSPLLFEKAPTELKALFSSLPKDFSFYVSFLDQSGTSAKKYFHEGKQNSIVNAVSGFSADNKFLAGIFEDGTTFIQETATQKFTAFKLPKLPAGFCYGDFILTGKTLYVSWEELNFYLTGKAGFISIDLSEII